LGPDADLQWNDKKNGYDYGAINWDEFFAVITGDGPCNKERLEARQKAWSDGAWFREGLNANAERRAAQKIAAE